LLIEFNIYIEQRIKEIRDTLHRNKICIKVGGEIISFLRFTNDIALLTNNEYNLEKALEEMMECYKMKINLT
jgi:competence protein ComGF